jgi:hypothetical protein
MIYLNKQKKLMKKMRMNIMFTDDTMKKMTTLFKNISPYYKNKHHDVLSPYDARRRICQETARGYQARY